MKNTYLSVMALRYLRKYKTLTLARPSRCLSALTSTALDTSEETESTSVLKTSVQQPFDIPPADNETRQFSTKILQIVDQIASLSLLEVSDLNQAIKKRLNIPDAPIMSYAAAAPSNTKSPDDDEETGPSVVTKTSFTVKLLKFDDGKKIDLIKEIKNVMTGMNLVQAKKYVESLPQVVKADIGKDEADKLKEKLEQLGGHCEVV